MGIHVLAVVWFHNIAQRTGHDKGGSNPKFTPGFKPSQVETFTFQQNIVCRENNISGIISHNTSCVWCMGARDYLSIQGKVGIHKQGYRDRGVGIYHLSADAWTSNSVPRAIAPLSPAQ